MKSLNLAAIISTSLLVVSGLAMADETTPNNAHQQNLSKRPYHQPVENKKTDNFEGATLVTDENSPEKTGVSKHKQLRINMLGQRPYVEDVR